MVIRCTLAASYHALCLSLTAFVQEQGSNNCVAQHNEGIVVTCRWCYTYERRMLLLMNPGSVHSEMLLCHVEEVAPCLPPRSLTLIDRHHKAAARRCVWHCVPPAIINDQPTWHVIRVQTTYAVLRQRSSCVVAVLWGNEKNATFTRHERRGGD